MSSARDIYYIAAVTPVNGDGREHPLGVVEMRVQESMCGISAEPRPLASASLASKPVRLARVSTLPARQPAGSSPATGGNIARRACRIAAP
ncbi:MAG: hypothetical protein OEN02_00325 [Gammaproteobacteria bacterium]|nr:hypothetical protein [Gammaproteobacteria bacterium]